MIHHIFRALKQRIEAIDGLPACSWFNSQYDEDSDEAVYLVPHVYLEFLPIPLNQEVSLIQTSDNVRFRVHLFTEYYNDENEVLSHYDQVAGIHKALTKKTLLLSELTEYAGLAGTPDDKVILNTMTRTEITPDHNQSNTIITIQEFVASGVDLSALSAVTTVDPVTLTTIKQIK